MPTNDHTPASDGPPTGAAAATKSRSKLPAALPVLMDIWERIKDHKILQWGLAYVGAALAIAHGQELMAHAFAWPGSVGRVVIALLGID